MRLSMGTSLCQQPNVWHIVIYWWPISNILAATSYCLCDEPMATKIAELHSVVDTTLAPAYTDPIELSQAMQGFHMRDILGTMMMVWMRTALMMLTSHVWIRHNNDYQLGGSQQLQHDLLHALTAEFRDINSYSVKEKNMVVPPMELKPIPLRNQP